MVLPGWGTSTHFSFFVEALGLFTLGFLAAVSSGLTVGSLDRFRKSGVLLTTVHGIVWQPSPLTFLTLRARARFTSLPKALPSGCSNDSAQPSVYSVSLRSFFNSCNTSAIPSLIGRNMFFYPAKFIHLLNHFLNCGNAFYRNLKRPVQKVFLLPCIRLLKATKHDYYFQLSSEQCLAHIFIQIISLYIIPTIR